MDTLPLELHSQIFELACADDGSTARSLALVSRYVRDVAEPYIFSSLAVAGLGPMTDLLAQLERTPSCMRRVRRLFLSDWTNREVHHKCVSASGAAMDRYDLEKSTIIRLLDVVAPTLHSFTFIVSCPFNSTQLIGHLFSLKLPHLRDLSVHGFYPFPHSSNAMPSLERLHLSGNRNPHGLFQCGALGVACPNLTHVRISGLVSAASFAEELTDALVPESCDRCSSLFSATLPPSVSHVTVQVGPAPAKTKRYSSACAQHERMSNCFSGLVGRTDRSGGVEFSLSSRHEDEDIYQFLHSEWCSM